MSLKDLVNLGLEKLTESESFTGNFFSMASGSAIVLVIQFMLTPVLSRIYDPEAYGTFSVYSALLNTVIIISTLGMKSAIMMPKNKFIFLNLVRLNLFLISLICLLMFVVLYAVGVRLTHLLQVEELNDIIYVIPLVAAVGASSEILASWHIKSGDFKTGPFTRVMTNLLSRSISIGYGVWVLNPAGT